MTAAAPCACCCVQRHLQRVCTPPDDAESVGAEHAAGHPPLARAQRRPRNPRAHRYGAPSRGGKTRAEQSAELGRTVVALALSRGSAVARLGRPRLILPASARFIWMLVACTWLHACSVYMVAESDASPNPMRRQRVGAGGGGAERRSVAAGLERGGWPPRESR